MSIKRLILILIFLKLNFNRIQSKESTCFINGQKALNVVNERFISFSIDPSILLTGFNLSSTSLQLAQHLSPAFIRIAGPSTKFLKFSDDITLKSLLEGTSNFTVTSIMWKSLNYWIKNANLTPVFALSDKNRTNGLWNPTSIIPLLELSGKMNLTCYWQLGYDCKDKSIIRYKHDLFTLKQALEEYSSDMKYWKIVGSDLQHCLARKNPQLAKKTLEFLDDVTDAVIWQEPFWKNPPQFTTAPIPIWLVVPKLTQPIRFSSGLLWAKQIGDAAKSGYEVIFRQPSLEELSAVTPVYWVSLIYKTLMGRNVLEVRTNTISDPNINVYANCAKDQDNYSKQGALTIFVVNNGTSQHTTSLRVASSHQGSIEVQSYIVTSDADDSTNTFVNGEKFTFHKFQDGKLELFPTLRRVRVNKVLNLVSPSKSVAFFVLPTAKIPVCIKKEKETTYHEQRINYPREELKAQIPEEYRKNFNHEEYPQMTANYKKPMRKQASKEQDQILKQFPRFLTKKPRIPKENADKTTKLEIVFTERPMDGENIQPNIKTVELELTNEEIKKILKDRAKSKVPDLASHEVENILKEAAEKSVDNTTTARKKKRFAALNTLRKFNKAKKIIKRDINMELLDLQTPRKKPSINNQQIEATIRKFGETSEELLKDFEKSEEKQDVFAELASSMEKYSYPRQHQNNGPFRTPFSRKTYLKDQDIPKTHFTDRLYEEEAPKEKLSPGAKYLDERVRFLMEPSGLETFLHEDLNDYHDFHENLRFQKMVNPKTKFNNEVPNMASRKEDNTPQPPFNVEIGELYAIGRQNHGKISSGLFSPSVNNEFASDIEQNPSFNQPDVVRMEGKPQFNDMEEEWHARGHGGRTSDGIAGLSISNGFVTENNKQQWLPQVDKTWRKNGVGIASSLTSDVVTPSFSNAWKNGNNGIAHNSPSVVGELDPNTEIWRMNDGEAEISTVNPQFNAEIEQWVGNKEKSSEITEFSHNQEEIPSCISTIKPQFDVKIEKWDSVAMENNEKSNPSPKQDLWENKSFSHTGETIIEPEAIKEVWTMDIFPPKNDDSKETSLISEEVTTSSIKVLQFDDFNPEHFEKKGNLALWKIPTEKPHVNIELGKWDMLSMLDDEKINDKPAHGIVETKISNEKLQNSSSIDMVSPWTSNQTFFQEMNQNPTNNNNQVSEMDKSFEDLLNLSETALPTKKIEAIAEKTIKDLENFFCDPKNDKMRFKRDNTNLTKDDIKNYRKFMSEQLRVMKQSRQSKPQIDEVPKNSIPKPKPKLFQRASSKDDNLSSAGGEHLHIVIGKPYDPEKLHINERKRAKQEQKLKQRLQNRKKLNEKIKERKQQNDVGEEISRSKRSPYNIQTNEVSDKKLNNWNMIGKHYKRRIFGPKAWKPQDIYKVKKVPSYSIEVVDKREFLQRTAPFIRHKFKETKRNKRSLDDGIDSSENAIEDYDFIKNKKFVTHQRTSTETTLPSRTTTQNWVETTENMTNNTMTTDPSTRDLSTTQDSSYNQTQKTEEKDKVINTEEMDGTVQHQFMDMIMDAVNTTIGTFFHLTEKIGEQFSF